MSLSSTSLAVTVAHAVTYLTRPLATAAALPPATLATLQAALEAHLAAAFVASWAPAEPTRGAGRRRSSSSYPLRTRTASRNLLTAT